MVKFKDFSRPSCVFQVLFKANLTFKDFPRQSCIFKYFSSLCEPCSLDKVLLSLGYGSCHINMSLEHIKVKAPRKECVIKI